MDADATDGTPNLNKSNYFKNNRTNYLKRDSAHVESKNDPTSCYVISSDSEGEEISKGNKSPCKRNLHPRKPVVTFEILDSDSDDESNAISYMISLQREFTHRKKCKLDLKSKNNKCDNETKSQIEVLNCANITQSKTYDEAISPKNNSGLISVIPLNKLTSVKAEPDDNEFRPTVNNDSTNSSLETISTVLEAEISDKNSCESESVKKEIGIEKIAINSKLLDCVPLSQIVNDGQVALINVENDTKKLERANETPRATDCEPENLLPIENDNLSNKNDTDLPEPNNFPYEPIDVYDAMDFEIWDDDSESEILINPNWLLKDTSKKCFVNFPSTMYHQ